MQYKYLTNQKWSENQLRPPFQINYSGLFAKSEVPPKWKKSEKWRLFWNPYFWGNWNFKICDWSNFKIKLYAYDWAAELAERDDRPESPLCFEMQGVFLRTETWVQKHLSYFTRVFILSCTYVFPPSFWKEYNQLISF